MNSDLIARVETLTRGSTLAPGLSLSVFDPAWMLARQWTFGEFDGVDGGTPVSAEFAVAVHTITRVELGGRTIEHDPALTPLDSLVQRRPGRSQPAWTARERVEVGRELLHAMRDRGLGALRPHLVSEYEIAAATAAERAADPDGAALLDLAAGRLPDGAQLYRDAAVAGGALTGLASTPTIEDALGDWRAWIAATLDEPGDGEPGPAWQPGRLEHSFSVSAPSRGGRLVAESQRGDLDWHSFDAAVGPAATTHPTRETIVVIPTPVTFRGMPSPRLWELEDASIDFGAVDAGPADLARMALLEFALVYGNDVFAFPVQSPVGSVTEVESLVVADTFGEQTTIPAAVRAATNGRDGWSFHALAGPSGLDPALLIPHVARHALHGPVLEDSALLRDEQANLVWAVEQRTEGGTGLALARAEDEARSAGPIGQPVLDTGLQYRQQTSVPRFWFPLALLPGTPRLLALATLAPSTDPPVGELLPQPGGTIHDEEVPREGVHVVREAVLARWCDGSARVWVRARREIGRGEGSSGLRFDLAEPSSP